MNADAPHAPATALASSASGGQETLIVLATQMWTLAVGLGTQAVLAWTLAPAGRGAYAVCMLFGGVFGVIFTLGTDRAAQYFVMSGKQSVSEGASVAVIVALAGSLLAVVIGLALMQTPLAFFAKADKTSFAIALALMPLTVLATTLELQAAGLRRFVRLGAVILVQTTTALILILLLAGAWDLGVRGALFAQVVASLLAALLLFADLRACCGLRLVLPAWRHFRQVLSYGARYYLARIGNLIDSGLGIFIIALVATQEDIGLFAAASALVLKVLVLTDSVETTLLPRIATDREGRTALVAQCVRVSMLFTTAATGAIVVLSVPLVTIVLSPKFIAAVPLIWILAPGVVLYGGSQILMAFFRGTGRPGVCSLVTWAGLLANGAALLVLYPSIGLPAAAWAATAGYACRSMVLLAAYRRATGQSSIDFMRFRRADFAAVRAIVRSVRARLLPAYHG